MKSIFCDCFNLLVLTESSSANSNQLVGYCKKVNPDVWHLGESVWEKRFTGLGRSREPGGLFCGLKSNEEKWQKPWGRELLPVVIIMQDGSRHVPGSTRARCTGPSEDRRDSGSDTSLTRTHTHTHTHRHIHTHTHTHTGTYTHTDTHTEVWSNVDDDTFRLSLTVGIFLYLIWSWLMFPMFSWWYYQSLHLLWVTQQVCVYRQHFKHTLRLTKQTLWSCPGLLLSRKSTTQHDRVEHKLLKLCTSEKCHRTILFGPGWNIKLNSN